jgi:predicted PurR-regulated permease PerM
MVVIGVMAGVGLKILGVDAAFTLGLTGGLLTFIPLVGALVATVPAILVALAQSPWLAVSVGVMFWFIHFLEGTFITPIVQDEQVSLPPVLTIFSTVIFAILFGASGVILATPIMLVVIVAIQMFYLEDVLGETPRQVERKLFRLRIRR